ncbi:MAG: DNA topoisomerase 1 [Phycisphaerae bacterium]
MTQPKSSDSSRRKTGGGQALVIVESPAKAKTISRYLGSGYIVESSIGHIRDLPSTAAEIPAELKDQSWARIGVNVEENFKPLYIIPSKKKQQVSKLKQLVKNASEVYLATDEDREGEAIAWHLREVLRPKVPVRRMVFDEITERAIRDAISNPRDLDEKLIEAQEARRILDRLYGYEVSPVLWRKIAPKLSAGRVQSVATRLIVDRERERMKFVAAEYWDIEAALRVRAASGESIATRLIELAGKRVATGKDFDPATGKLLPDADVRLLDRASSEDAAQRLRSATFTVESITEKPFTQKPAPPFITSTLQQEAARKLRYPVQLTMRLAQSLYENGHITYMRTDSTHLSSQAIAAARKQAADLYGPQFLPDQPRHYTTKAKGAQEAHEAIRPAGEQFRTPRDLEGELTADLLKLYDLIWKRTLACQMKDAAGSRTGIRFTAPAGEHGQAVFSASGKTIHFPGFLRAYVQGADDGDAERDDQERILPPLSQGQELDPTAVEARQHTTVPPARYTEASLIKELEDLGIGRPSTYASIVHTIQDRGYVWKKGTALVPTLTAFAVINLLERHFEDLVDFGFTAKMEGDLDAIASGELRSVPWLQRFYFGDTKENGDGDLAHMGLKRRIGSGSDRIDPREVSTIEIGKDEQGQPVAARIGRYGPYIQIGDTDQRANIPEDTPPDELSMEKAREFLARASQGSQVLGQDPASGKPVYLKTGRFGPYVQLGDPEVTEKGKLKRGGKPKMASLWPGMKPETMTLEDALKLLSFPREVGRHPETGETITVQDGRFGPYVRMGNESRSLASHEQMATINLDEALSLLAQPKRGRGAARQQQMIADLGKHASREGSIQVKQGRFGPYVTDGVVNASLPKGTEPAGLNLDKAIELLNAREQRMREQGKDPRAPKKGKGRTRSSKGQT